MSKKFLRPLLIVFGVFLILQLFGNKEDSSKSQDDIALIAKKKMVIGKEIQLKVQNNGPVAISIPSNCPNNPLTVEQYVNGEWILKEAQVTADKCENSKEIIIQTNESQMVAYGDWSWQLFNEIGRYRITLSTFLGEKEKAYSHEVNIVGPGIFRNLWTEGVYKPILNTLIYIISVLPNFSLGWGVILLTFFLKLILLAPNHKALKAQKQMQKVQPQLEALKRKYKSNPQRLTEETMKIWKKYKVNPMSSCMPMLIQFPILIGLFYVIRDGLGAINPNLLYGALKTFDVSQIQPIFLGLLDLTKANKIVLPLIVGGLQFYQMHLTLGKVVVDNKKEGPNPALMMNKMMKYVMPIMIAVFTASLPAAVGLYWGTSTLFGIGQQFVINRSKD